MRVIAGLGNPGGGYAGTRHNVGWMTLDRVADLCGARGEVDRGGGLAARCGDLLLFKPTLYMNRSGPPVARLLRQKGLGAEDLLVLVDDVALPLGSIRLRPQGSAGGHNGLGSLVEALGTQQFARLRMGVGPCPRGVDVADFVLSDFADAEWDAVERMTETAAQAALCWHREGAEAAMNRYNRIADNPQSP